jgi:dipeptidyl aminopeptidase/acylaminoacyl peptidase
VSAPTVAPYGTWASPLPVGLLTAGALRLAEPRIEPDGTIDWLEGRPDEGGRQALMRLAPGAAEPVEVGPPGMNVRTRVHEYGGGPYLAAGPLLVVSDFATGRLHVSHDGGTAWAPLTPECAWRYADLELDAGRGRLIAIREDHEPATLDRHGEAENAIVAVSLADGAIEVLVDGHDFFAAPRLSPDGTRLAWLEWDHPNLPWDGTTLRLAGLDEAGVPDGPGAPVAGGPADWISQPRWSPDGRLQVVAEPDGWMNLFRVGADGLVPLAPMEAEFAYPDWVFALSDHAFLGDGGVVASGRSAARTHLYRIGPAAGAVSRYDLPFSEFDYVAAAGLTVVAIVGMPTEPTRLVRIDAASGAWEEIRRTIADPPAPADLSRSRPVTFPTTGGREAHGVWYPPHNRAYAGPDDERPPLIVTSHGGPTAQASTALQLSIQLFTSRGYGVLDVDYGGSSGYGTEYRKRLEGEWGVVDLDDCVAGARWLAGQGLVDPDRTAIRGGSASGYTTLCAVTFRDTFRAGTTYFGIGDLETFVAQTHKFESRYLERLVGPYPATRERYRERSPLNFPDRISCPVLVLQGAEDRIVPPAQAEQIVDALWERRLPHAYLLFAGEDHGFRQAANIIRSFEAELSFYGQVFGFRPADDIEPVSVEFLAP